jgi:hypothetical protein
MLGELASLSRPYAELKRRQETGDTETGGRKDEMNQKKGDW